MEGEYTQGIMDNSPFIAWVHNLSKNQMKYLKSKIAEYDLDHEVRYVMMIYENPNISQDDLVIMSGQSKGNKAGRTASPGTVRPGKPPPVCS